jgi:DNA-binding NarL/FixJ family response regulator
VEDEVMMRLELADTLKGSGLRVLPVASAEEALEVLQASPDVQAVVTDVRLSGTGIEGVELARRVCREWGLSVVVISGQVLPDELPSGVHFLSRPVHAGTLTHLVHSVLRTRAEQQSQTRQTAPFRETVGTQAEGAWTLTRRQQEVLELLVQGKSNREIAEAMGLSENTVKVHLVTVFKVLGVSSRTEALLAGLKRLSSQQDPPTLLLS